MCDMREVGIEWGIKQGIAKGKAENQVEMVQAMRADGVSLEKALQYAKLDYDTYKQLESKYGSEIEEYT